MIEQVLDALSSESPVASLPSTVIVPKETVDSVACNLTFLYAAILSVNPPNPNLELRKQVPVNGLMLLRGLGRPLLVGFCRELDMEDVDTTPKEELLLHFLTDANRMGFIRLTVSKSGYMAVKLPGTFFEFQTYINLSIIILSKYVFFFHS